MSTRLVRLAKRGREERVSQQEKCDLCGQAVPADHRHVLDLESGELMCACRACRILFERTAAGGGHFRLVPERRLRLTGFRLDDAMWDELRIPVDMAFFFRSSAADRVVAFYPGPMGATESLLELRTWRELEDANVVLAGMEPDTEALLVNRARGAEDYWLVPIDDCYTLVGLIRAGWRGLTGGKAVWEDIRGFYATLDAKTTNQRG
jgi:uncharacterized protein DUF5947